MTDAQTPTPPPASPSRPADKAVELMKVWVEKARRPEVIGGIGGFAGLFDASALTPYDRPLLATSTDGVGTKVAIAQAMDMHDTIGFDLVGMVVDDLVVCGAEPLFMTDYIACGRVVPERIAAIVKGIAEACVEAGCALIGGETAEHPGLLGPDEYDVAGADHRRGRGRPAARPRPGPARRRGGRDGLERAALQRLLAGPPRAARHAPAGRSTATSPSSAAPSARSCSSRPGSTPRPASTLAARDRDPRDVARHRRRPGRQPRPGAAGRAAAPPSTAATWTPQPIFDLVRRVGDVPQPDLEATLNCGVGMVALLDPPTTSTPPIALLAEHGDPRLGGRRGRRPRPAADGTVDAGRPAPRLVTTWPLRHSYGSGISGTGVREQPRQQVALSPRETDRDQTGRHSVAPAKRARGSTLWGAAEQRRSRRRSPAT